MKYKLFFILILVSFFELKAQRNCVLEQQLSSLYLYQNQGQTIDVFTKDTLIFKSKKRENILSPDNLSSLLLSHHKLNSIGKKKGYKSNAEFSVRIENSYRGFSSLDFSAKWKVIKKAGKDFILFSQINPNDPFYFVYESNWFQENMVFEIIPFKEEGDNNRESFQFIRKSAKDFQKYFLRNSSEFSKAKEELLREHWILMQPQNGHELFSVDTLKFVNKDNSQYALQKCGSAFFYLVPFSHSKYQLNIENTFAFCEKCFYGWIPLENECYSKSDKDSIPLTVPYFGKWSWKEKNGDLLLTLHQLKYSIDEMKSVKNYSRRLEFKIVDLHFDSMTFVRIKK